MLTGSRQLSDPHSHPDQNLQILPGSGYQTWPASYPMPYCPVSNVNYVTQASITAGIPPNPLMCPANTRHFDTGVPMILSTPPTFAQQPVTLEAHSQPAAAAATPFSKTFEVEDVVEVVDSPTPSDDISSPNSATSLDKDGDVTASSSLTDITTTQEQVSQIQAQTQTDVSAPVYVPMGSEGLESVCGSSIGAGDLSAAPTDYPSVSSQPELPSLARVATQSNVSTQNEPQLETDPHSRRRSASVPQVVTSLAQVSGPMPAIPESGVGYMRHSLPEFQTTRTVPLEGVPPSNLSYAPLNKQPSLDQVPPHHAQLLANAFGKFLHAMNTMLRDPSMEPLIHSLNGQFGNPSPSPSQPSSQPVSPTSTCSGPRMSPRVSVTPQVCCTFSIHNLSAIIK